MVQIPHINLSPTQFYENITQEVVQYPQPLNTVEVMETLETLIKIFHSTS